MADLNVVIVTWNVRDLALQTLGSLYADLDANGPDADVYVVDSASTDGTADAVAAAHPRARLMRSEANLGFGAANNLALRTMGFGSDTQTEKPKAVYLLNPDTITQPGATRALYNTLLANPRRGVVGANLRYGDGSFQHGAFAFPGLRQLWAEFFPTPGRFIEGRFNGRYPRALYEGDKPFPVDFVLGATMMLRREAIEQTGLFDEAFFMYCEEIDWQWRIHDAGWEIACVPTAHVTHLGGQSTGQVRPQSAINLWTSRLKLFDRHYPAWKRRLARTMIALGMRRRQAQENAAPELLQAYRTIQQMAAGKA
jgi:GT2 family glycosyltransferase